MWGSLKGSRQTVEAPKIREGFLPVSRQNENKKRSPLICLGARVLRKVGGLLKLTGESYKVWEY